MSNSVKAAAAVGIIVLAGGIYYLRAGSETNDLTSRREYNALLKCRACGAEYAAELNVRDIPPYACEKCGKREAWHLWECRQCHKTFVPEPQGNPPRAPIAPACPECGSVMTGRAHPAVK